MIGITYYAKGNEFTEQKQFWGTVIVAKDNKILVRQENGEIFRLPPDLRSIKPAPKGEYRLHSTDEIVVAPDYTSVWNVNRGTEK